MYYKKKRIEGETGQRCLMVSYIIVLSGIPPFYATPVFNMNKIILSQQNLTEVTIFTKHEVPLFIK